MSPVTLPTVASTSGIASTAISTGSGAMGRPMAEVTGRLVARKIAWPGRPTEPIDTNTASATPVANWAGVRATPNAQAMKQAVARYWMGEVMRNNETAILVATTVVEVGVDVPNATVMIINNAESYGLSQLHQLRGRIGRGEHRSWCILLSDAKAGDDNRRKLDVMCSTINGFEIAEEDFKLRGPGDVLGTAQSGFGRVRFMEWLSDTRLIHRGRDMATAILETDPGLNLPQHAPLRDLIADDSSEPTTS